MDVPLKVAQFFSINLFILMNHNLMKKIKSQFDDKIKAQFDEKIKAQFDSNQIVMLLIRCIIELAVVFN